MSTYTYIPNLYQFPSLLKALAQTSGPTPSLDLRFALDKSLTAYRGPTPSFSRASTGSYFDGSGVLRYATVNTILYSEDFSNAYWVKSNATVSTNQTVSPDGKTTADLLYGSSTGSARGIYAGSPSATTISVYAKSSGKNWIALTDFSAATSAWFNLSNGTVGTVGAGYSAAIQNAGNGWYRCSLTKTTGFSYFQIYGTDSDNTLTATVNGTDGVFIWGAQGELSSTVGTYCPTTSSANSAPRFDHTFNGTSWVSRGLLVEEQRTNTILYSEDLTNAAYNWGWSFATANQTTAPDGNLTADSLTEASGTGTHYIVQVKTNSAGTYTLSAFVKFPTSGVIRNVFLAPIFNSSLGNDKAVVFNSSGQFVGIVGSTGSDPTYGVANCGNGWFRFSVTATSTSFGNSYPSVGFADGTTLSYNGNGTSLLYIWGYQYENASFASSYIPSLSNSSTTRSADVCQITGGDFSGFYNQNEGSVVLEFDGAQPLPSPSPRNFPSYLTISKGNSGYDLETNSFSIFGNSDTNKIGAYASIDRVTQYEIYSTGLFSPNMTQRSSFGYAVNNFGFTNNGENVLTDTSGTNPNQMAYLHLGKSSGGTFSCHIARLRYYRKRLPNETLQLLSEPDPTLNLQFALNKSLTPVAGPAPSFSRASTGSYFDSTGTLKYANVNLITWSEDFTQSAWNGGSTGRTPNTITAPDGTLTADTLSFNGTSQIYHATTGSSAIQTFSAYVKKIDHRYVSMQIETGASAYRAVFDLDTASVTDTNSSTTASIISVGNGWYRCSVTNTSTASSTLWFTIQQSATATFSAGVGLKQFYVWGAQAEFGSSASQYAKTTGSTTAGPRFDHAFSGGQWVSKGLLVEEQRTNILNYSEDFSNAYWFKFNSPTLTANTSETTSPDGTNSATKVVSGTTSETDIYKTGLYSGSGSITFSIYAKAGTSNFFGIGLNGGGYDFTVNFDLSNGTYNQRNLNGYTGTSISMTGVGNGWYRCSLTANNLSVSTGVYLYCCANSLSTSSTTSGNSNYLFGAQLEVGSFATSYIKSNSGSSATRSADVCQITGTSFNWMWNQGEGSVNFEFDLIPPSTVTGTGSSPSLIAFSDSSNNQRVWYDADTTPRTRLYVDNLSTSSNLYVNGNVWGGVGQKVAYCFKVDDLASCLNGGAVQTDNSQGIPTGIDRMSVGYNAAYGANGRMNGHIAKLIYYPARLTNTKLQQLST